MLTFPLIEGIGGTILLYASMKRGLEQGRSITPPLIRWFTATLSCVGLFGIVSAIIQEVPVVVRPTVEEVASGSGSNHRIFLLTSMQLRECNHLATEAFWSMGQDLVQASVVEKSYQQKVPRFQKRTTTLLVFDPPPIATTAGLSITLMDISDCGARYPNTTVLGKFNADGRF